MYSKQATVINATGIHARPASQFVDQAKKFKAGVTVRNTGNAPAEESVRNPLSVFCHWG